MQDVFQAIKDWFIRLFSPKVEPFCEACLAKDYFIATLKEELRSKESLNVTLINKLTEPKYVERVVRPEGGEVKSIRARTSTIKDLEAKHAKPELTEQRHKEYTERIEAMEKGLKDIEKSEVEVVKQ